MCGQLGIGGDTNSHTTVCCSIITFSMSLVFTTEAEVLRASQPPFSLCSVNAC